MSAMTSFAPHASTVRCSHQLPGAKRRMSGSSASPAGAPGDMNNTHPLRFGFTPIAALNPFHKYNRSRRTP